jgi:hypothetical protein
MVASQIPLQIVETFLRNFLTRGISKPCVDAIEGRAFRKARLEEAAVGFQQAAERI